MRLGVGGLVRVDGLKFGVLELGYVPEFSSGAGGRSWWG